MKPQEKFYFDEKLTEIENKLEFQREEIASLKAHIRKMEKAKQ